jgi:hypothetical protein
MRAIRLACRHDRALHDKPVALSARNIQVEADRDQLFDQ